MRKDFDVSARLRAMHLMHGPYQRELAKRAGVSNAIISLIEQNRPRGSSGSLKKVRHGLPISLADFFAMELAAIWPETVIRWHHAGVRSSWR